MSRRCSFLISKASAKLYQKFYQVELRKERSKNAKKRWVWVRVEMCQAFQTLRSNNIATACSLVLLFVFSAIKEPAKELRLSFTLGEK